MGFLGLFSNSTDIALQIYNYYSGGIVTAPFKVSKAQRLNGNDKHLTLLYAIQQCGTPTTPKQLYIVSHCYVLLGAKYRPEAIEYLTKYIQAGACWSGTTRDKIRMDDYICDQLLSNKADVMCKLGKAYEGEYDFDNAMDCYMKALELDPVCTTALFFIADVYVKKNKIPEGLKFLVPYKKSQYKDMKLIAKSKYNELQEKKTSGYIYKPRRKKSNTN